MIAPPGETAMTAGSNDALISADELQSVIGVPDTGVIQSCVDTCFDFIVPAPAGKAIVALPLDQPMPWYITYRRFDPMNGIWGNFIVDENNSIKSSTKNDQGYCPAPGDASYSSFSIGSLNGMLRPGDECIQLTIEDGGPNDSDHLINMSVSDPGGPGQNASPSSPSAGGGCSLTSGYSQHVHRMDWWILSGFLSWLGYRKYKRNSFRQNQLI
jgi:hypothetical protein